MNSRPRADLLSTWLGLAVLGSLTGCADDELPLPPVVWEGQAVRVRMDDPAIEVCGGSFEALDRHAVLVREALLLDDDGLIEYSIGDEAFVQQRCEGAVVDDPIGCTTIEEGYIFTHHQFIPHEIVHSVRRMDRDIGLLSSIFEEGLATLFGSDSPGMGTTSLQTLELFDDPHVGGNEEYFRAGHVMAILFDEFGAESLRRFDRLARETSEDTAFEEAFGEPKAEFAARTETMPTCEQSQWWIPLLECDGEPIVRSDDTGLTFTGDLSCGQPDVQGPEYGRMWTSRHFRLDERTSELSYEIDMPDDATFEIVGCDAGCPDRLAYIGGILDVGSVINGIPPLEPGDYFFRISRPVSSDSGKFMITID